VLQGGVCENNQIERDTRMTTTIDPSSEEPSPVEAGEPCRVAVFYDTAISRRRAVELADHLTQRFMAEVEFRFAWWCLGELGDGAIAEPAALTALEAEVLVFAAAAADEPDATVRAWMEMWAGHRLGPAGVLVPLLHPATPEALSESIWMIELEELARRTGLECLLPSEVQLSPLFDQTARRLQQQTKHMGWLMDGILRQPHQTQPPVRWGLGE
jgi:hypothetical protein